MYTNKRERKNTHSGKVSSTSRTGRRFFDDGKSARTKRKEREVYDCDRCFAIVFLPSFSLSLFVSPTRENAFGTFTQAFDIFKIFVVPSTASMRDKNALIHERKKGRMEEWKREKENAPPRRLRRRLPRPFSESSKSSSSSSSRASSFSTKSTFYNTKKHTRLFGVLLFRVCIEP